MTARLSIFGVVFFVSKFLLGIEKLKKHEKFARILKYQTWPIVSIVIGWTHDIIWDPIVCIVLF